jgi:NAD-dependent deacetylase
MDEAVRTLKKWVDDAGSIVFFGGAGVSTESGIPDFRSVDGLYSQKYDEPPETMVSHAYLEKWPEKFFRFYREKMIYPDARPNGCHLGLAKLERRGKLKAVITQNIDGLHQAAGSREVLELHGSVHRNYCVACGRRYGLDYVLQSEGVPRCSCGALVRPDVVLYGESLDQELLERAVGYIRSAELLIVGGTSLTVQPAAG